MIESSSLRVEAAGVQTVHDAAARHAVGFRLVHVGDDAGLLDRSVDVLCTLGFVIVRGEDFARLRQSDVKGRHVALVTTSAIERLDAVPWVRMLSRESPRGHVVVTVADDSRPVDGFLARERAATLSNACCDLRGAPAREPDRRQTRAGRYSKAGKVASAGRWTEAAIAAARRRGDESSMVAAATAMIDLLVERADLPKAVRLGRRLLDAVQGFDALADAAALLAWPLLLEVELDVAEALLAGVRVEAALREVPVPARVIAAAANTCVWRGRFEEAVALARMHDSRSSVDQSATALAAWAVRDRDLLRTCRSRVPSQTSDAVAAPGFGAALVDVLLAAVGEAPEPAIDPDVLVSLSPPWLAPFARAVAIESWLQRGGSPGLRPQRTRPAGVAPRAVPGLAGSRRPAPLFQLLLDWQEACACGDEAAAARVMARARHAGLDGLARWGRKDARMHFLHDWATLLRIVHEADDELGALTSGCAWMRRQGHADAVAVADADGTSWIAMDGWSRGELAHPDVQRALASPGTATVGAYVFIAAAIRYAGHTVGRVIARGDPAGRATLEQAVQAFAAIAGPAVRGRLDTLAIARSAQVLAPDIIGRSPAVRSMRDAIARAAGTVFPVLIEGESGTGKELVARALHKLSPRRDRRFCAVNCAAFTDELFEAELFGYTRGAFTGAVGARAGLVEDAHEGTLFLDEVGDLSARAQAKLLRTLQEREVRRLGENAARRVDVRVVAATNVPLGDAVTHGRFREDLLFRLAVIRIRVPPLRDRSEDIPLIAQACWRRLTADAGKSVRLGPDVMATLCQYPWPGNIRELQNALAALLVLAPARGRVTARHLSQVLHVDAAPDRAEALSLDDGRRSFERKMIVAALARHGGRQARAALDLGLTRQGLAKAMRRLDLDPDSGGDAAGVA